MILGINPSIEIGKSGGIACIDEDGTPRHYIKMPTGRKELARFLISLKEACKKNNLPLTAYLEKVDNLPPRFRGAVDRGRIYERYGWLAMGLDTLQIPYLEITSRTWQTSLNCMSRGRIKLKTEVVKKLFPDCKITHASADAFAIAEYGRRRQIRINELKTARHQASRSKTASPRTRWGT